MTTSVGTMFATWVAPDGTEWPLTDTAPDRGYFTTREIGGWGTVPVEYTLDPMPRGGESVRYVKVSSARLVWPLNIYGDTHQEFLDRYRAVKRAFTQTALRGQAGTMIVYRPDGSARQISGFYEDGFRGEPGENWLFANPVITLLCPDSFWQDVDTITVTRSYAAGGASFLNPFPTISSSQVLGSTTVNNPGDVQAWPSWVINGPMTALTAVNNTTSQAFTLTYTLLAGETITMTTDRPTVRGPAGQNLVGSLNWPAAYLWGLATGDNDIDFSVGGASAGTAIQMSFNPRYDGA